MNRHTLSLLIAALLTTGCSEAIVDLTPDAARIGEDGAAGRFGVTHQSFTAQARATEVVHYTVHWPSGADGTFDDSEGRCPVVMFIHGGFVSAEQYGWLPRHFASRGYCVVSPDHPLELAIMESDNASIVLDALQQEPPEVLEGALSERAVVMGHSLGGAVGTFRWIADERFEGLVLLASWPGETTPVEPLTGRPSLSIIGSQDKAGEATQTAFDEYQRFPDPKWFGVVDGMNHYDWADGATDANLAGDGTSTRPQEDTRRDAVRVIDTWLDAWLRDGAAARAALNARAFPNVAEAP